MNLTKTLVMPSCVCYVMQRVVDGPTLCQVSLEGIEPPPRDPQSRTHPLHHRLLLLLVVRVAGLAPTFPRIQTWWGSYPPSTLVGALPMTVGAHYLALFDLSLYLWEAMPNTRRSDVE